VAGGAGIKHPIVGQNQRHGRIELAKAAQYPVLPHRLVVTGNAHRYKELLSDLDLTEAMHALALAMSDDIPLGLRPSDHLMHVAAADLVERSVS
jgi:hypothetical protein